MADVEQIGPANRVWRRQPGDKKRQRGEPDKRETPDPEDRDDSEESDDGEHIDVYV